MKSLAVIPAFNDHSNLPALLASVLKHVDHVILVDDGSTTPLRTTVAPSPEITILRHAINLGKGAAMKTGVVYALGAQAEIIIFLDADGQHSPEEIPALLTPLVRDDVDIVFGKRSFQSHMPLIARLGNVFLTKALLLLFGINVADTQSGFRAFRASVYPQLSWDSQRYAVETEMIVNAAKHKLKWAEVPIQTIYNDRYRGTTVIDGFRILLNMITWRLQ